MPLSECKHRVPVLCQHDCECRLAGEGIAREARTLQYVDTPPEDIVVEHLTTRMLGHAAVPENGQRRARFVLSGREKRPPSHLLVCELLLLLRELFSDRKEPL